MVGVIIELSYLNRAIYLEIADRNVEIKGNLSQFSSEMAIL